MKQKLINGYVSMLVALGCSGRLTVDRNPPETEGGEGGAESGILAGPCLPGALQIEAKGSTAEAEVRLPDRCTGALVCSSEQVCVAPPSCADSTDRNCVVDAGTERGAVVALTGDDSYLYFLRYGTNDELGNYQNDGALFSFAIAEGTTTTIASGLSGPKELGITSTHAYFWVDGGALLGAPARPQLFRVPLGSGTPELVEGTTPSRTMSTAFFGSFVGAGDVAVWTGEGATYAMAAGRAMTPQVLIEPGAWSMVSDGADLLYADCLCSGDSVISRVPVEGGTPEALVSPFFPFAVSGESLYGIESLESVEKVGGSGGLQTIWTGTLLVRAAKSGGQWERMRALGGGGLVTKFQLAGDRYFYEQEAPEADSYVTHGYESTATVVVASLTSNDPPVRLLERPNRADWFEQAWVGTSDALFWTDGAKIYSRAIEP